MRRAATVLALALLSACSPPGLLNTLDRAALSGGARVGRDVAFGAHGQRLDVWRSGRTPAANAPVIVFFYGGGWVAGTRQDYGWAARAYASRGFLVVLPDYRKVPAVRFPAFVEDAADAVKWTHDHATDFGGDPNRIAVVGHSAGAYAVAMLALDQRWLRQAGAPADTIKAAVGLSGPYDFYPFTERRGQDALGRWPRPLETQPITFARADAPPMLLVTGDADTLVQPRNSETLAARLRSLGASVEFKAYPRQGHEDIAMALSVPFRGKAPVLDDSVEFLQRSMGLDRTPGLPATPPPR